MCRLRNVALESVTCDRRTDRRTTDKVINYASQATQKGVSERVSVPCWHVTPVANAPWKPLIIRWRSSSASTSWNFGGKSDRLGSHCWSRVRMPFNIRERETSYGWIRSPYRMVQVKRKCYKFQTVNMLLCKRQNKYHSKIKNFNIKPYVLVQYNTGLCIHMPVRLEEWRRLARESPRPRKMWNSWKKKFEEKRD